MRVRAIRRGFDNVMRREVGEEFDLPDSTNLEPGTDWFVVVKKEPEAAKGPAKKGKSGDEDLV